MAIADPFSREAAGACVPTFPARSSRKTTTWMRINGAIGSNGYGVFYWAPTLSNNAQCYWVSNAPFTGVGQDLSVTSLTTGISSGVMANGPYNSVDLIGTSGSGATPSNAAGRIVSAGLKLQYTGTQLNMSGQMFGMCSPDHQNLNGEDVTPYKEAEIRPCTRTPIVLQTAGISAEEVSYGPFKSFGTLEQDISTIYPFSGGQHSNATDSFLGAPIFKVVVTGVPGETFYVECVQHAEYIGQLAAIGQTESHADARGFEVVQQAASSLAERRISQPGISMKGAMMDGIRDAIHSLRPGAIQLTRRVVGNGVEMAGRFAIKSAMRAAPYALLA